MYQATIAAILAALGRSDVSPPRHVEAFIRLEYRTLDHLSRADFRRETAIALECIDLDADAAERLAQSFGL